MFPDTPANRAFVASTIDGISRQSPVVLLNTPFAVDDHHDFELTGGRVCTISAHMTPERNLAVQTAVIARARAFVGTYGGYSYLAPFCGVTSLAFYSERSFKCSTCRVAQHVFAKLGVPSIVPLMSRRCLVRLALRWSRERVMKILFFWTRRNIWVLRLCGRRVRGAWSRCGNCHQQHQHQEMGRAGKASTPTGPRTDARRRAPNEGMWGDIAYGLRGVMVFVRYFHPRFAAARALRARIKRKVLPAGYHWLDRVPKLPPAGVSAIEHALMAAESAIPVCQPLVEFLREQEPDVVLVSPLNRRGLGVWSK